MLTLRISVIYLLQAYNYSSIRTYLTHVSLLLVFSLLQVLVLYATYYLEQTNPATIGQGSTGLAAT